DAEVGRTARDVEVRSQRDRLAGVTHFSGEEVVEAGFDASSHAAHDFCALVVGHQTPLAAASLAGGLNGTIDHHLVGNFDLGDDLACGGVDVVIDSRVGGFNILAVDEGDAARIRRASAEGGKLTGHSYWLTFW